MKAEVGASDQRMDKSRGDTASEAMTTVDRSEGNTTVIPIVNLQRCEIIAQFPNMSQIDERFMAGRRVASHGGTGMLVSPRMRSMLLGTTLLIARDSDRSSQAVLQIRS